MEKGYEKRKVRDDVEHYTSVGKEVLGWALKNVGSEHIVVTSGIPEQAVDEGNDATREMVEAEQRKWLRGGKPRSRWGIIKPNLRRPKTIGESAERGN
jgi:hypothetical protein